MKKSRTLWVLIAFFTWAALKSAGSLYWYEPVSDYALLSSMDIGWLFFVLNIPNFFLELTTAFLLFKKKSAAFFTGVANAVLACIGGTVVTILSSNKIDTIKSIYIASREARGMTVNQESLGFLFTPTGLLTMLLVYFGFYAIIIYYLYRVKSELAHKVA